MNYDSQNSEIQEARENFRHGKLRTCILCFLFIGAVWSFVGLRLGYIATTVTALTQTVLCALAWLIGSRIIPSRGRRLHILLAILAFAMAIVSLVAFGFDQERHSGRGTFSITPGDDPMHTGSVWPSAAIATMIPEPDNRFGDIYVSEGVLFSFEVYDTSSQDFADYVSACEDMGYTVHSYLTDTYYMAKNDDRYDLSITFDTKEKIMDVTLCAPDPVEEISWPDTTICQQIPEPPSTLGFISYSYDDSFAATFNDISQQAFSDYVRQCKAQGFDQDSSLNENMFFASNSNKYHLNLEYDSYFSTMKIHLYKKTW